MEIKIRINENTVFAWLRAAVVAAGAVGTLIALWLGYLGISALLTIGCDKGRAFALAGLATVLVTSVCCYAALTVFYRMCGRLKRGSAFTEHNARAMARIAAAFVISAIAVAASLVVLIACGLAFHLSAYVLFLFVCLFGGLALLSYALCLLVRRAAALQQESELTI